MRILCGFLMLLGPVQLGYGQAPNASAVADPSPIALSMDELRKIQQKLQQSNALTVDFMQTSLKAFRGSKVQRQGKGIFVKPNMFKWMLETPVQEYKIFDGKSFYDYIPNAKRAVQHAPTSKQSDDLRQIVDVVMNIELLFKKYELISAKKLAATVHLRLKPKAKDNIKEISLILDESQSIVSSLVFEMQNGDKLMHDFSKPNRSPVSMDVFKLPADVKVSKGF
jgi:outer membrane lipoprotein-sorting protein